MTPNKYVAHLAHVDTGVSLTQSVSVTQLSDNRDGVKTSVLCERRRYNFESISVCLETECLHSLQGLRILRE